MLSMKIDDSEGTADGALGGKEKSENPHAGELETDNDLTPGLTREDYLGVKVPYCETYDERMPRSHDEPTSDYLEASSLPPETQDWVSKAERSAEDMLEGFRRNGIGGANGKSSDSPPSSPSDFPSNSPTDSPSNRPSVSPSNKPTDSPSNRPTIITQGSAPPSELGVAKSTLEFARLLGRMPFSLALEKHAGSRRDGVNREVANALFRQKPQTLTHSPIER